jgi:hypothetical protein
MGLALGCGEEAEQTPCACEKETSTGCEQPSDKESGTAEDTGDPQGTDTACVGDPQGTDTGCESASCEECTCEDCPEETASGTGGGTSTESGTNSGTDTGTGEESTSDTDTYETSGTASITFTPVYGSNAKLQFSALWKMSIPGYDSNGKFLLMLCPSDDPTCLRPVVIHEVTADEIKNSNPIQNTWGPQIEIENLPEGTWNAQVIYDSGRSRAMGYAWDDDFPTKEKAWGGIVSESDMMLAASDDHPAVGYNPPPSAMEITLVEGEMLDINTTNVGGMGMRLPLEHYHERDISPDPTPESGIVVAATGQGARIVDLANFSVKTSASFGGTDYYDFTMVDDQDNAVDGGVCGMVKGPGNTVFLLFLNGTVERAGFAVQFNPITGEQVSSNVVNFPGGGNDTPCRGVFHEYGGNGYLWVANVPGTPSVPASGMWYANVTNLESGNVEAGFLSNTEPDDGDIYQDGIHRLAALNDTLYLVSVTDVAPCGSNVCVFQADFAANGKPTMRKDAGQYIVYNAGALGGSVTVGSTTYSCVIGPPTAGMTIAEFHDGRDLLFVGTCLEIAVFDLANNGDKLDFNGPAPGRPGMPGVLFGEGLTEFSLAPDGKTLWVVPASKSTTHFCFQKGNGQWQTYNRHMFMPIDLSQDAEGMTGLPGIAPEHNLADLDGDVEQNCTIGTYDTPVIDPGVDLDFAYLKKYIVEWAPDLAGATPTSIPVGPSMAAANHTLWMRGSGVTGVSGLANQGHLAQYDLASQKVVLWPQDDHDFYEVWMGGTSTRWGFDMTPNNDNAIHTKGLLYFPL